MIRLPADAPAYGAKLFWQVRIGVAVRGAAFGGQSRWSNRRHCLWRPFDRHKQAGPAADEVRALNSTTCTVLVAITKPDKRTVSVTSTTVAMDYGSLGTSSFVARAVCAEKSATGAGRPAMGDACRWNGRVCPSALWCLHDQLGDQGSLLVQW